MYKKDRMPKRNPVFFVFCQLYLGLGRGCVCCAWLDILSANLDMELAKLLFGGWAR